jgi:hypothetical protein
MLRSGGCLCGKVRYQLGGEPRAVVLCYCNLCRRSVGATPVAWASVRLDDLQVSPEISYHSSSPKARRGFCPACGTSLTFESEDFPGEIDITVASLDDAEALTPQRLCFVPDRLRWAPAPEHLPRHRGDTGTPPEPAANSYTEQVLELWHRALMQISLQALPDPVRAQRIAEALAPACDWRDELDAPARLRERVEELAHLYPDGARYLSEPLS